MDWQIVLLMVYLGIGAVISIFEMTRSWDSIDKNERLFGFFAFVFLWPYVLYKEFKQE